MILYNVAPSTRKSPWLIHEFPQLVNVLCHQVKASEYNTITQLTAAGYPDPVLSPVKQALSWSHWWEIFLLLCILYQVWNYSSTCNISLFPYFHNSDALTLSYIHFYPATFTFSLQRWNLKFNVVLFLNSIELSF